MPVRILLLHSAMALVLVRAALAADPAPGKSLDEELFEDLAKPAAAQKLPRSSRPAESAKGLEDGPLTPAIDGEDIDLSGKSDDPLARIEGRMRQAESLIVKQDTSTRTQTIQLQILRELDMLVEQAQQQCENCKKGGNSSQAQSKPKPGSKNSQGQEGTPPSAPPRDSTDELRQAGRTEAKEAEAMAALVKQSWGHLPEKVRNQLLNVTVDQFLPKYEKLIEAYYARLAEESR